VVFGSSNGFSSTLELSSLNGSDGFVLNGITDGDYSGFSVSGAGDINGDGIDDLIIGATGANGAGGIVTSRGACYVVFGSSSGFSSSFELSSLDGSNGFVLNGIDDGDQSGSSVSGVGDVNGDGIDDLIIGARGADPNGSRSGESYVVFGSTNVFNPTLELSVLTGSTGFIFNGIDANDYSGVSVSGAGDVNGDGLDDLIIGAGYAAPNGINSGESYVVFGDPDELLLDIDGDGSFSAFTDSILIARFAFGFTGSVLIADAIAPGATRTTAPEIEAHLNALSSLFESDLDTDSLL
jgi:hypothetical protein